MNCTLSWFAWIAASSCLPLKSAPATWGPTGLADGSDPRLRSDMWAVVYVVAAQKEATLLPCGPAIAGAEGGRDVFVLLGEVAVRRRIQIGLSGFDYCQVLAGLVEGEEVIISDTAEFLTLPLVAVR